MKLLKSCFLLVSAVVLSFFYSCSKSTDEGLLNDDNQAEEYIISDVEAKLLLSDFIGEGSKTRSGDLLEIGDYEVRNYQISTETKSESIPVYQ
jgi:hypothetical protein